MKFLKLVTTVVLLCSFSFAQAQYADIGLTYSRHISSTFHRVTHWYGMDGRMRINKKVVVSLGVKVAKLPVFRPSSTIYNNPVDLIDTSTTRDLSEFLESSFSPTGEYSNNKAFTFPVTVAYSIGSKSLFLNTGIFVEPDLYYRSFGLNRLGLKIEPNFVFQERYTLSCSYNFTKFPYRSTSYRKGHQSSLELAIRYRFLIKLKKDSPNSKI